MALTNDHEFAVYLHAYMLFNKREFVKVSFLIYGKNFSIKNEYFKYLIISSLFHLQNYQQAINIGKLELTDPIGDSLILSEINYILALCCI